ncbi:MAG: SEC-C domain-containing protein [Pseudonocardiaceae bacterium]
MLADRAVAAYHAHRGPDYGYPRAFRAGLLVRLGRDDEAMVELKALRPLLSRSADAVLYISETLEGGGRAEIAEEWLAAALLAGLARQEMLESQRGEPVDEQADKETGAVMFTLARQRHRLRRSRDLPHDALDNLADLLMDEVQGTLEDELDEEVLEGISVLFWPHTEFDQLLQRWPELAETYGRTWDEHRAGLQRVLVQCSEHGHTRLALLAAAVDEFADYATHLSGDPTDPQIREGYAQHLGKNPQETPWPPGRNQACWCGSGLKYKEMLLPPHTYLIRPADSPHDRHWW